ncbi:MAG: hypothetical protein E7J90_12830 [Cutibacterium avidum]|nr:hypothetical protein [Cutibacterium avidum]
MRNSIGIGGELAYTAASAAEVLKIEEALTRFDRLHAPLIRMIFTDGVVRSVRLGEADQVALWREAVDEDTIVAVRKELDDLSEGGVLDVAMGQEGDIVRSWTIDGE